MLPLLHVNKVIKSSLQPRQRGAHDKEHKGQTFVTAIKIRKCAQITQNILKTASPPQQFAQNVAQIKNPLERAEIKGNSIVASFPDVANCSESTTFGETEKCSYWVLVASSFADATCGKLCNSVREIHSEFGVKNEFNVILSVFEVMPTYQIWCLNLTN